MTKNLSMRIAEYIKDLRYRDLDQKTIDETKKRILDSIGVAIGALHEAPYIIARKIASKTRSLGKGSVIWGENFRSSPENAAFANGVGVRVLDFNDTYLSKEALHPSDMIPAIIALGEELEADGKQVILSIVAAYEIASRLADAFSVRSVGVDHVTYIAIGTAAGVSKLMDLPLERIYHAINLATNEAISLRQSRAGELSMWKGCTAANSAKKGLFATLLASEGMTGPSPVFEGEFGFFNVISKQKFDIERFGGLEGEEFRIHRTSIKYWPVEYHAMSAVEASLKLREKVSADQINKIHVKTFTVSYRIIVKDPEKWDPKTRETADHSLPYIIARTLIDGRIWIDSFTNEKVLAQDVRELMKKMYIEVDPEYDKIYPEGIPNTVMIETKDKKTYTETSIYPPGHFRNPLDWRSLEEKFTKLVKEYLKPEKTQSVIELVKKFDSLGNINELTEELLLK
ncbi:MAG: MmgE/PrpD family protein [Sulfolobales archaeon]